MRHGPFCSAIATSSPASAAPQVSEQFFVVVAQGFRSRHDEDLEFALLRLLAHAEQAGELLIEG